MTNFKQMAAVAAKSMGYGVHVHRNLRTVVILKNTEWVAQQTWGTEISVTHRKIFTKYRYNHIHNADHR